MVIALELHYHGTLNHTLPPLHNINVNGSVYCLKSPLSSADLTIYANVLELSLIQSHLLWGEFSIAHFAAAIANHYNLALSFHQVPITAGWTGVA